MIHLFSFFFMDHLILYKVSTLCLNNVNTDNTTILSVPLHVTQLHIY